MPLNAIASGRPIFISQVETQDKKKHKTGRAKRRLQYNRRFVNVVTTFGRQKGPNSNTKWTWSANDDWLI